MGLRSVCRALCLLVLLGSAQVAAPHPLKLSLAEIDYSSEKQILSVNLRLFLTDVNEALVFDPNSTELAFCQPNEAEHAERLLLEYLDDFFYVNANGQRLELDIKSKSLHGKGDNTALALVFEYAQAPPLKSLAIKNAVFTDLFFDQNNLIYVNVNGDSETVMLNKKTPEHRLTF